MRRDLWLWVIIGCALLLNSTFLVQRAALEARNDRVEVVMDGGGLFALARHTGVPVDRLLGSLQRVGVSAVAVGELSDPGAESDKIVDRDYFPHYDVPETVSEQLEALPRDVRIVPRSVAAARAATEAGFTLGPFVAQGETIEGYPDSLQRTADTLRELRLSIGVVEFSDIGGVMDVVALLDYDALFTHSIPPKELVKLSDNQAVARFHRAVLERQARVLYIHPLWDGSASPDELLARNEAYLEAVAARVHGAGLHIGPVTPLPRWSTPMGTTVVVALAAGAALLLLVGSVGPLPTAVAVGLLVGVLVVPAVLFATGRDVLARQGAALAVAVVFPALAIHQAFSVVQRRSEGSASVTEYKLGLRLPSSHGWRSILLGLLVVLGGTAAGALLVAGALGDVRFLLKLEQFRGVKLAHIAPFGMAAALWLLGSGQKPDVSRLRAALRWQHVVLAVVFLLCGFVFVARTGHDLLPVSRLERAVREWLETTLAVRPRTKEFLLGYPALLAALMLAVGRHRRWAPPMFILGTVVPVSVINSFAHAHVPLLVSVVRSFYGLLLGTGVAFVFWGILAVLRSIGLFGAGPGARDTPTGIADDTLAAAGATKVDRHR